MNHHRQIGSSLISRKPHCCVSVQAKIWGVSTTSLSFEIVQGASSLASHPCEIVQRRVGLAIFPCEILQNRIWSLACFVIVQNWARFLVRSSFEFEQKRWDLRQVSVVKSCKERVFVIVCGGCRLCLTHISVILVFRCWLGIQILMHAKSTLKSFGKDTWQNQWV